MVRLKNLTPDEMMRKENNDFSHTFLNVLSKAHALFFTGVDACTHIKKNQQKDNFAGMKYIHEQYIHFLLLSCCLLRTPHICRSVALLLYVLSRHQSWQLFIFYCCCDKLKSIQ